MLESRILLKCRNGYLYRVLGTLFCHLKPHFDILDMINPADIVTAELQDHVNEWCQSKVLWNYKFVRLLGFALRLCLGLSASVSVSVRLTVVQFNLVLLVLSIF